jgi:hypothetical protein
MVIHMSGTVIATTMKNICFWIGCSFIFMSAFAHAAIVNYSLENVILDDSSQMTGTFSWTFDEGDFENGVGRFTSLFIPHTSHDHNDLTATIEVIQSIEITLPGSTHDDGIDITLVFQQALTPTSSSSINLVESKYEIGGNGFHDGMFLSGFISVITDNDGDGVADEVDNCPLDPNSSQENNDGDSMGDVCDPDNDNDGRPDDSDANPLIPALNFCTDDDAIIGPWSVISGEILDCRAQLSISSSGSFLIHLSGDALFMSPEINLLPGFSIQTGGTFAAVIATDIAN